MLITHLSGPAVRIAKRVVQRCMVCGAKLYDSDGGGITTIRPFNPGRFVEADDEEEGTWMEGPPFMEDSVAPRTFCLRFIE